MEVKQLGIKDVGFEKIWTWLLQIQQHQLLTSNPDWTIKTWTHVVDPKNYQAYVARRPNNL